MAAPTAGPTDHPAEASFAAFVRSRWGRLVRLAYSLTLDVGRAEDLVQESQAKLWFVWPRVRDGSPATPHCVVAAGERQAPRCFATFPAAILAATGGRVTDAPASAAVAVRDPAFTAALEAPTTLAAVVVGIEYADINYGGATLSMTAPGRCDYSMDVDYRFASMPYGWNDRISSFRSYSNCAQQLFRGTSFSGGALTNIVSSMSYVGSTANDQASSVTFN